MKGPIKGPFGCNDGFSDDHWEVGEKTGFLVPTVSLSSIAKNYGELWRAVDRMFPHIPHEHKQKIVSLVVWTCQSCHSAKIGDCQCEGYNNE